MNYTEIGCSLTAPLQKEALDMIPDGELLAFVNDEYRKHLQYKSAEFENYVFDIDDGNDGNPARKSHHFMVRITGCGPEKFEYTRKMFYHEL